VCCKIATKEVNTTKLDNKADEIVKEINRLRQELVLILCERKNHLGRKTTS